VSAVWTPDRLPEDQEAERSLLATLCASGNERQANEIVWTAPIENFVHPAHAAVWRALKTVLDRREEVSLITLKAALEDAKEIGRVGGVTGLIEILQCEEVARPEVLVRILGEKRKQRELIRIGTEMARRAAYGDGTAEDVVNASTARLASLGASMEKRGLATADDFADDWMANILDRMQGRKAAGLRTGFSRFDRITQGFKPGQLIILAARPGIGKTALVLNWALGMALRFGARGGIFSLEMGKEELFERLVGAHAGLDMREVTQAYDAEILQRIHAAAEDIRNSKLHFNDEGSVTVRDIRLQVERLMARVGKLDFLIVDYLQIMDSPEDSRSAKQSETTRIGAITRALKLMAKDLGFPVILLSQLNREVEKRQGGKPQLSDLRDSGSIEQDADMVLFIHRRMKPQDEEEEVDRSAELLVAKHRNGPTGIVHLFFEAEQTRYREIERFTNEGDQPPARLETRRG
jgi:replicative DNA helicase